MHFYLFTFLTLSWLSWFVVLPRDLPEGTLWRPMHLCGKWLIFCGEFPGIYATNFKGDLTEELHFKTIWLYLFISFIIIVSTVFLFLHSLFIYYTYLFFEWEMGKCFLHSMFPSLPHGHISCSSFSGLDTSHASKIPQLAIFIHRAILAPDSEFSRKTCKENGHTIAKERRRFPSLRTNF